MNLQASDFETQEEESVKTDIAGRSLSVAQISTATRVRSEPGRGAVRARRPNLRITVKHSDLSPSDGESPRMGIGIGVALIADQIGEHRAMLVRVARQRLRNDAWAEDAVSETLMAALEKPHAYSGRASLRTWLVGILKHKVVDQFRHHTRECQNYCFDDEEGAGDDPPEALPGGVFDAPSESGDPQECLIRSQFMAHLEKCMQTLPPQQARAILLRDCMGEETELICNELGVTSNNLAVMLHRGRGRLRASLQIHGEVPARDSHARPSA